MPAGAPQDWDVERVVDFLNEISLAEYASVVRKECIDGDTLKGCRQEDLIDFGFRGLHASKLLAKFSRAADDADGQALPWD